MKVVKVSTLLFLIALCLLLLVGVAHFGPPTPKTLTGNYVGNYAGGQETFVFNPNGTFSQRFVKDGRTLYFNRGTWDLTGSTLGMTPFISPVSRHAPGEDLPTAKWPFRYDAFICEVDSGKDIVFSEDDGIYISKR